MKQLILLLLVAQVVLAQKPFSIDKYGEVTDNTLEKLVKKRGYEVVSAFDTVWKKPVLIYAQYIKGGKFGIIDNYGNEVTPAVYDKIDGLNRSHSAYLFGYHGNYIVQQNKKYGIISNTGKKLIEPKYKYLYPVSRDSLLFNATLVDETEITIDLKDKLVKLSPEKDPWAEAQASRKPDQTLSADGKTYHLRHNWTGKETVVPNLGTVVSNFGNQVVFKNPQNKVGVFSLPEKKMVIPFKYDEIKYAFKGYFQVREGKLNGILDSIGGQRIPVMYEYWSFTSGGASAYLDKKYTLFDMSFRRLSEDTFEQTGYMGQKGLTLKKDGKWGLMATDGKILAPFEYDALETPGDHDLKFSIILARKNGKYGVMDFGGKIYTDFIYDRILPESNVFSDSRTLEPVFNGYANQPNMYHYVKLGDKWGLLDNDFKPMIDPKYDYFLESYDRSVLFAKKNGKWGMIDVKTEKPIIDFIYDGPLEWKNGNYQVYKEKAYGLVDRTGKILIPIQQRGPINTERVYNGLWQISDYSDRSSYYLDYAGRKTVPVKWPVRE